jgi:hypothetical protein
MEGFYFMKRVLVLVSALVLVLTLAACGGTEDPVDTVTEVTLAGLDAITVTAGDPVDLLTGVTATGDDGNDYSDLITLDSDSCYVDENNTIDTSTPGSCTINYSVVVDGKLARGSRTVTIDPIQVGPVEGPVLAEWHWDSEDDLTGWTKYEAGSGSVAASVEDGALKLVTTSGGMVYETRYEYMGLPLEDGQSYQVTFRAKSDTEGKALHLQFGELLAADPYFYDFKPGQTEYVTLGTDWAEYTYSFTYNKDLDSGVGGPLFEMGDINDGDIVSVGLDATVWIDDLVIKGGSGEDNTKPEINGADDLTIFIEDGITTFDPMEGVTALDFPDVDLTSDIIISGDTVDPTTAGTYTLYYVVIDAAFNYQRVVRTVTVLSDTEAPMVSGIADIVLQAGTAFDPLEGVAATDNRDGDVTEDIVLGGDTVDSAVPSIYYVDYTVTDAAGNTETYTRMVTISAMIWDTTDILVNGDVYAGAWTPWFGDQWSGVTTSTFDIVNGEMVVEVSWADEVTPASYATQIFQEGFALENGKFYQISFDAKALEAKDINVAFGDALDAAPWFTNFADLTTVTLGTEYQTFTIEFEMTEATTADQGKLVFELATSVETTVYIDNVMLQEIDALGGSVVAETEQVLNGTFDANNADNWAGWYGDQWSGETTSSLDTTFGMLEITVEGLTESHAAYATQVFQEGMPFVLGETYKVSFRAMADAARQMNVNLGDALDYDPYFTNFAPTEVVDLTTEWLDYEFVFTMTEATTVDQGKLVFELGTIDGVAVNTVVRIDDVMIEQLQTDDVVSNGDFSATGWGAFVDYWWWSGAASEVYFNIVDGEMEVNIVEPGGAGWAIQPNQVVELEYNETENVSYKVTFDAYADAARTINAFVGFQQASDNTWHPYGGLENVALTTELQTFEYMITVSEDNGVDNVELKFECGGDATNWYFDNVTLVKWDTVNDVALGDNLVVNGTFDQAVDWGFYNGDEWNGYTTSTVSVADNTVTVDATGLAAGQASFLTQLYQEGLTFRQGVTYTVQFDANAEAARQINVNLGEPFSSDPWFVNFTPTEVFDLTTDVQTFSFTFTMSGETNENGKLVFELGVVDGVVVEGAVNISNIIIFENYNTPTE